MKKIEKDVPHAKTLRAIAKYNAVKRPEKAAFKYLGANKEIVEVSYKEYSENIENMIAKI